MSFLKRRISTYTSTAGNISIVKRYKYVYINVYIRLKQAVSVSYRRISTSIAVEVVTDVICPNNFLAGCLFSRNE